MGARWPSVPRLRALIRSCGPELLLTAGTALLMAVAVATVLSVWP